MKTTALIRAELIIKFDGDDLIYAATSGLAGYQSLSHIWSKGKGPLPPGQYVVTTSPTILAKKGIEGEFYHITPDPIFNEKLGVTRGEFGIHLDANVPGTSGCIGLLNSSSFRSFVIRMDTIRRMGHALLPLSVIY